MTQSPAVIELFEYLRSIHKAVSLDDLLFEPNFTGVIAKLVNLKSQFSKTIGLNIPIVSSPMDKVTGVPLAVALAMEGGLAILPRGFGFDPISQANAVIEVKRHVHAFIDNPEILKEDWSVKEVYKLIEDKNLKFDNFPVMNISGKLVGILDGNDLKHAVSESQLVKDIMKTDFESAPLGTDVNKAYDILSRNKAVLLPIIGDGVFKGMFTWTDAKRIVSGFSQYNLDKNGNLRVGAAIGADEESKDRLKLLCEAKVDVIVLDLGHGHTQWALDQIKYCKENYPHIDIVAGNIATARAAQSLIEAGADGLRVGVGNGSICITRIVTGMGVPQATAVFNCSREAQKHNIPVCADGGIRYTQDMVKCLALGASSVMLGSLLAGTYEAPGGEPLEEKGQKYKLYYGQGSEEAAKANPSSNRYTTLGKKIVPEGVSGKVAYSGLLSEAIYQHVGGIIKAMIYFGANDLHSLQSNVIPNLVTPAAVRESHVHSLLSYNETSNYKA